MAGTCRCGGRAWLEVARVCGNCGGCNFGGAIGPRAGKLRRSSALWAERERKGESGLEGSQAGRLSGLKREKREGGGGRARMKRKGEKGRKKVKRKQDQTRVNSNKFT